MKLKLSVALGAAFLCAPAIAVAQVAPVQAIAPVTAPAAPIAVAPATLQEMTISAGLPISLAISNEVSSSRNKEGETVAFTVSQDVMSDGVVVIPRGTRAVGEITLRSGRGMFGKSGKMEIAFRYLELDGRRVPLSGAHFQAGEGNTGGTVGAVLAAGVVGGMVVTGRSANVPEGREFTARTQDNLPVVLTGQATGPYGTPLARIAATYTPSPISTGSPHRLAKQQRKQEARQQRTRASR